MILAIYGYGDLGRELHELVREVQKIEPEKWSEVIYCDDATDGCIIDGIRALPLLKIKEDYKPNEIEFVVGVGEPFVRKALAEKIEQNGYHLAKAIVHPGAFVASSAVLDDGVIVHMWSHLSVGVHIKKNAYLQNGATIGHDTIIGENCIISHEPGLNGSTVIGDNCYIAEHTTFRDHITIGNGAIVGMAATVTKSFPEDDLVLIGSPAKVLRKNTTHRVF